MTRWISLRLFTEEKAGERRRFTRYVVDSFQRYIADSQGGRDHSQRQTRSVTASARLSDPCFQNAFRRGVHRADPAVGQQQDPVSPVEIPIRAATRK